MDDGDMRISMTVEMGHWEGQALVCRLEMTREQLRMASPDRRTMVGWKASDMIEACLDKWENALLAQEMAGEW